MELRREGNEKRIKREIPGQRYLYQRRRFTVLEKKNWAWELTPIGLELSDAGMSERALRRIHPSPL